MVSDGNENLGSVARAIWQAQQLGIPCDTVPLQGHPKPGLVLQAQLRWDIDLASSLLIGDCDSDCALARACGMSFVRVRDGRVVETIGGW